METKYLLDECIKYSAEQIKSVNLPQVIDYLPRGTSDDKVLEEANKRGLILVTRDMKFVVRTVRQDIPVIYDHAGHWHLIAKISIDNPFDRVGIYCRNNNSVILP
jgi:rRNA-processing protein FCF1